MPVEEKTNIANKLAKLLVLVKYSMHHSKYATQNKDKFPCLQNAVHAREMVCKTARR